MKPDAQTWHVMEVPLSLALVIWSSYGGGGGGSFVFLSVKTVGKVGNCSL